MYPIAKCKSCNKIYYVDKYCDDYGGGLELIIKEVVGGITKQIKEGAEVAKKEADHEVKANRSRPNQSHQ